MGRIFYRRALMLLITGLITFLLIIAIPAGAVSITATDSVPDWVFVPGSNTNPTPLTVTVSTDPSRSWTVSVRDSLEGGKNPSSAGRLLEYNPTSSAWVNTGNIISTNLSVIGQTVNGIQGYEVPLGPTDRTIESASSQVTDQQLSINLQQPITYSDPYLSNGNIYRVVLTFTVTQN
jgi:hypothetical protein